MSLNVYVIVLCFAVFSLTSAYIDNLYCGKDNCYEVLDVNRENTKHEITKAYRKLARKWHPDRHRDEEAKELAHEKFRSIATAYEVLKDEETRRDYDYMLDNPEEYYAHYYRYYRRRMSPQVDVRIVIAVCITAVSGIQYWSALSKYNEAIDYFLTIPKYRLQATDIARKDGLMSADGKRKKDRSKTKEEIKQEQEALLRTIIIDKMDIKGTYEYPTLYDVAWVQLFCSPYWIACWLSFHIRWIYKFTVMKHPYEEAEQLYIIKKSMEKADIQWKNLEDYEIEEYLHKELWDTDNFKEWKRVHDEEKKAELSQNTKYKQYRRYNKKGGAGQISFGPD